MTEIQASQQDGMNIPKTYGISVLGLHGAGQEIRSGVFDENQVRAAAGITMLMGAIALVCAYSAKEYLPIQTVTTFFFMEFVIRVRFGLQYSPLGHVVRLITHLPPQWVSAKPKRFAWTLGLVLSFAMMVITNADIRGPLPLTICLVCLSLMWLESVLGLCLGCEIHAWLVRRGWMSKDEAFEICASGACNIDGHPSGDNRSSDSVR
ncbi:DUF4395 family protein [Paracoccus aestuariivivens]|uniref:DUF4395 family protein n=1 Tax=Paracoccus aestuariivivens TaxID=1820333 RepID=UPI0014787E99